MSFSKISYQMLLLRLFFKLLLALIALSIILLLAIPIGFYGMALYLEPKLPSVNEIKTAKLEMPLHIYSADNKLVGLYGNRMSLPVSFEQIPEGMINALLAAEDSSFFEHSGISVKGLGRAVTELLTDNDEQTGGSTITMQVAKNYFLSSEQTFERKITELFLSRKIESEFTKNEIITLYVNKIYLGEGAYGIKAAAKRYFSKSLDSLSIEEYALIAGLPKAPSAFNPVINPERSLIRRDWILGRMLHHEFITQEAYDVAVDTPLELNLYSDSIDTEIPYISEMARYSLVQQFGKTVMNSGWRVKLTVNAETQETANNIVRKHLLKYDRRRGWRGAEASEGEPRNFNTYLDMNPAKVVKIGNSSFKAELKSGEVVTVPWSGMSWARGRTPSGIVSEGEIVRLSPNGDSWKLVQPPKVQGSLVSLNPESGAIIALVGGFHYRHSKFNRATNAYRQPGSTIKPLVYSAALEKGYTPSSLISDSPLRIGNWRPKNSDGRYYGPMELRRALYLSRNLVSIRLLRSVGTANALNLLEQFGLDKDKLPSTLSLALGAGGATPLQMATAYSTFANGGHRIQPYLIEQIYDFDNKIVFQANPKLSCASCFNDTLEDLNKNQKILTEKMLTEEKNQALSNIEGKDATNNDIVDLEKKLAALEKQEDDIKTDAISVKETADSIKVKDTSKKEKLDKNDDDIQESSTDNKAQNQIDSKLNATAQGDRLRVYPVQYKRADQATRILSPSVAYDMAGILRDVIRIGTAKKARSLGRSDIGGKTGTTNNFKDAWFAGFQPTNATVVWIGFDQPKSLGRGQFGGRLALPVWMDFMRAELKDKPVQWVTLNNEAKSKKQQQQTIDIKDDEKPVTDDEHLSLLDSLPQAKTTKRIAPKPKFIPSNNTSSLSNSSRFTNTRAIQTQPTVKQSAVTPITSQTVVRKTPKKVEKEPIRNTPTPIRTFDEPVVPVIEQQPKNFVVQQSLSDSDVSINNPVVFESANNAAKKVSPQAFAPAPAPAPAPARMEEIELDIQEVNEMPTLN